MKNIKPFKHLIFIIILLLPLLDYAETDYSQYAIKTVQFKAPMTAESLEYVKTALQYGTAKKIFSALYQLAFLIGGANLVRIFAFHPDQAKKATKNFIVGILIASVIMNLF
jgi:hypothetical protein